jgi:3-oxoacyl-[acyl-carrier protein] reductase
MAERTAADFSVRLNGHAAIVTGGGAELGRACALSLARAGAAVVVGDVNPDSADETALRITEAGGRALALHADVSNRFQASALIEGARDAFGRITLLVNAASIFRSGPLDRLDEWDWRRVIDVNLTGAFFMTQLLGRVMADEEGGAIVNLASFAGAGRTLPDGVSYTASKAGLLGLTQQAARELAPRGVRVNAVCPGAVSDYPPHGPENALGRPASDDDIAAAVLFLLSDGARFITGQALHVDGLAL